MINRIRIARERLSKTPEKEEVLSFLFYFILFLFLFLFEHSKNSTLLTSYKASN